MSKIYCNKCKFYDYGRREAFNGPNIEARCVNPLNRTNYHTSYISDTDKLKNKPSEINKFSDCKWFTRRRWWMKQARG